MNKKLDNRASRKRRVKRAISGRTEKPRMTVYRSNSHIYCQIIDDKNQKTLVESSDLKLKVKGPKIKLATEVGRNIAVKAIKHKITKVVFDRNGNKYHGRVKALADGAREGGLIF